MVAAKPAGRSAHRAAKRSDASPSSSTSARTAPSSGWRASWRLQVADQITLVAFLLVWIALNPRGSDELAAGGVLADHFPAEEGASHLVAGDDRPSRVDDDDGHVVEATEETLDGRGDVACGDARGGIGEAGETMEVLGFWCVETQCASERRDDRQRWRLCAALFESDEVVDRDAGQRGDLFASQSGRTTRRLRSEASLDGVQAVTPGAKRLGEVVVHFPQSRSPTVT